MAIPRAARSFGAWLAIGLLLAIILPAATSATTITGLPPVLSLDEHPFTRNPELQLVVMRAPSQTDTVVERRASNSPTTVDGVLAGDLVPEVGMWTLAPGPDGTRTVYGQLKYASGAWSPVGSVSVELDQSPATSMYADIDQSPVFYDASTGSPAPDWHERSSTPTDPVYGYGISFPSPDAVRVRGCRRPLELQLHPARWRHRARELPDSAAGRGPMRHDLRHREPERGT